MKIQNKPQFIMAPIQKHAECIRVDEREEGKEGVGLNSKPKIRPVRAR